MEIESGLIDLFLKLVTIEGTSGKERQVADFIADFLRRRDFEIYIDKANEYNGGDSGNLIGRWGSGGELMLLSHMDTVSSTADLKPVVLEDRITTEGNTILGGDDRAGIAVILYAIDKLKRSGVKTKDFTVAFTVDEERNLSGSKYLQPDKNIKMGIVFDSHSRPGNFIIQTYGCREFNVTIKGKAAHAGIAPEKGVSSIQIAAEAISRMKWGRISEDTTANVGKISGGSAMNMVPETTSLLGEVRSLKVEKVDELVEDFRLKFIQVGEKYGGKVDFKTEWAFKPYNITPEMKVYQLVVSALKAVGLSPQPAITPGGSDANNLNTKGIPAVNLGIGAQNPHSVEEFILLEDLANAARIVQEIIKDD